MAMQIDAGIDFMLWLTGQEYALNVFDREYSRSVPRLRKAAPLAEMYAYVRKEREEQRLLKLEEYTACFLNWAGRYLQTNPAVITSRGESIAVAAVKKIGQRITEALHRRHGTNKNLIASVKHHSSIDSTSKRPKTGFSKGSRRKRKRAASLAISTSGVDKHQLEVIRPITVATPTDGQQGISIDQEERSRTQDDCNEPHSSDSSEVVDDQQTEASCSPSPDGVVVPLPTWQGGQSLFQDDYNELHSSDPSMVVDDQETDTPYGPSIDEVAIPMPTDDQCDQGYPQEMSPEVRNQADDLKSLGVTPLHGCPVQLLQNGTVQLNKPSQQRSLRFRMSNKEAKRILEFKKAPTIHFTLEEIRLHVDNDVVYRKPIERLLGSKEGPEWLIQITREFENLFQEFPERGGAEGATKGNELTVIPHSTSLGTPWKNGELQRKLRQGASFPCNPLTNGTNMGRVCFRGVQLLVPETADFATVQIQCDLVAAGLQHSNPCATKIRDKDPATRLGIKLKFASTLGREMKELWATLGGEANTKKLNSLVDFLDGKDEQWTEQQPRRFLDKNKGRGRTKPSYTS